MKKALILILAISLCFALGFGIGKMATHLAGGESNSHIDIAKLAWVVLLTLFALVVSFVANTILHEAGHLVCGLLTGFRFLSFRIWSFTLQHEGNGWHLKKFNIAGTLGQCLMVPPSHSSEPPYFWYNAGGVIANLLTIIISGTLICLCNLSMVPFLLNCMMLFTGAYLFIVNAIPMKIGGLPNDGMNIRILWKNPDQRVYFHNMMTVVAGLSKGKRPSEMPSEWFASRPVNKQSTVMELSARSLHCTRLIDQLKFGEAHMVAEEMAEIGDAVPMLLQIELACDRLLLELVTHNRLEVINELWNKKYRQITLSDYIKTYRKYFPMKCTVLYAYELINNQSADAAQAYHDEVLRKRDTYTQKGEALMAIRVMNEIRLKTDTQNI